jgi:hypothetical protein
LLLHNSQEDWGAKFIRAAQGADDTLANRLDNPGQLLAPNWIYKHMEGGKRYMISPDATTAVLADTPAPNNAHSLSSFIRPHRVSRVTHPRYYEHKAILDNLCMAMITERRAIVEKEGPSYFTDKAARGETLDFLDIVLSSTNLDGTPASDDLICGQCITFIAAGFGTTTTALGYTLYCLALHKDHQEKCHEEAKQVLAEGQPDLAALKKLKHVSMCFKEATRLYPPVRAVPSSPISPASPAQCIQQSLRTLSFRTRASGCGPPT